MTDLIRRQLAALPSGPLVTVGRSGRGGPKSSMPLTGFQFFDWPAPLWRYEPTLSPLHAAVMAKP